MALSFFEDKTRVPDEGELSAALGEVRGVWDEAIRCAQEACGSALIEWKHYGKKSGWTLLVKHKKRTLFYLIPLEKTIKVVFVLGERSVGLVEQSSLPASILQVIREATPHVEGRSFSVPLETPEDLSILRELVHIKVAC